AVFRFQCASGAKAGPDDREDYGVENRLKLRIEGAVNEHVSRKRSRHLLPLEWGACRFSKSTGLGISIDPIATLFPDSGYRLPDLLVSEVRRRHSLFQNPHAVIRPANGFIPPGP